MLYTDKSCREFIEVTASKEPVPGGGSVSALVGALGTALGRMVASLTIGKKKYIDVEEEMKELAKQADVLKNELLELVQADMEIFEPLSKLYGMKAETEGERKEKDKLLEKALADACEVPLAIMEKCGKAIEFSRIFADKGSKLAISDAAASAELCKGAMRAASLNVFINTGSMQDKKRAEALNKTCGEYMDKYCVMAEEVFEDVVNKLRG